MAGFNPTSFPEIPHLLVTELLSDIKSEIGNRPKEGLCKSCMRLWQLHALASSNAKKKRFSSGYGGSLRNLTSAVSASALRNQAQNHSHAAKFTCSTRTTF